MSDRVARFLLFQQEDRDIDVVRRDFERAGYVVWSRQARTIEEMASLLIEGEFDLVIVDDRSSGSSLLSALELCRDREVGAPILVLSNQLRNREKNAVVAAGATGCFSESELGLLAEVAVREFVKRRGHVPAKPEILLQRRR